MYQPFSFAKELITCCLLLFAFQIAAQNGQYDLRFNLNDCDENRIFIDIEIKASNTETTFILGDQNYRFSYTRNTITNPFISEELEISGTILVDNNIVLYSPHDLNGSQDTIVSYNFELLSNVGYELSADEWVKVGRLGFDIIDPTACLSFTWHTPNFFPPVYVSETTSDFDFQIANMGTLKNLNICLSECNEPVSPLANDDNISIDAGSESVFNILGNDTAPTGASFETVTLLNNIPTSQGIISVNNFGLTTFIPTTGFVGNVTPINYEVCADNGLCDQAAIYITVEGEAPTANDDNVNVASLGGVFNILTNDIIPTGQSVENLTITTNLPASEGTITVTNNGLTNFTPAIGFSGNVSPISYEVCVDNGLCDQAVIYISIQATPPTANDDNVNINAGTSGSFNILANDNTSAGSNFQTIELLNAIPSSEGILTTNNSGLASFTPAVGFVGNVSPVTYEVCTDNGFCDQANIYITVVGEFPVANDDNVTVNANTQGVFNILANDAAPSAASLETVTILTTIPAAEGVLTINNSGLTSFTPTADFSGNVTPIDYEICASNGLCNEATIFINVLPPPAVDIIGTIYGKDGTTALTKVDIVLSGDANDALTTTTGAYNFEVPTNGNYTITPTKTSSITNGVTAIDLAISQGHILGLFELGSVYDVIAMDVNQSCTLSAIDLSITQAVILGLLDEFPEGKSWKFVPANIQFPNLDTPCDYEQFLSYENLNTNLTGQNFIGMKIGDVNNSYNPTGGFTSNAPMLFSIANALASPDEIIQIPVSVSQATDIMTWQLTHTWDADVLEFQGIEMINEALTDGIALGEQATTEGQLTSMWLHPENLSTTFDEATPVYYLTFKVIGQTGTSTQISINSDITPTIAYNADFEEINIISTDGLLEIQAVTDVDDISSENNVLLFENIPNPFNENTTIHFELPQAGEANILIYNILGKQIKHFNQYYEQGAHRLDWNDAAQFPAGIYTCELQFEQHIQTIKLLLVK